MKAMKKLSCVLLAVLLLMSLSVTAFASGTAETFTPPEEGATFKITLNENAPDHKYVAYQIFAGDLAYDAEKNPVLSNIKWGTGVTTAGQTAVLHALYGDTLPDPVPTAAEAAEKLNKGNLEAVAAAVAANVDTGNPLNPTGAEGAGPYESNDLNTGYYLVIDTENPADAEGFAMTDYIVQVVGNVNMTPKASAPSIEKKVQDKNDSTGEGGALQDSADYDIGDTIPYQITVKLPSTYADYDTYKIVITDTLSKGLTFNNDVEISGLAKDSYSVDYTTTDDGETVVTITIANLKTAAPDLKSGDLILTYSAELDEDAVIGTDGNPNTVQMEYSNNPNTDQTGHTPEDTVTVFTFDLDVKKVDEEQNPLKGAEFKLEKWENGSWVTKDFVTSEDGTVFSIDGIDDGIYQITETKTPAGYNSIDPIVFQVSAKHDEKADAPTLSELKATVGTFEGGVFKPADDADFQFTATLSPAAGAEITSSIVNQSGLQLPETGGIGTTIFYTVGGILVAAALVLLITKKRMSKEG